MNGPSYRELESLLEKLNAEGRSNLVSIGAALSAASETIADKKWIFALSQLSEMFPLKLVDEFESTWRRMTCKIDGLHKDVVIAGTVVDSDQTYRVLVQPHVDIGSPAGCSCSRSSGELPCVHSLVFVDYVLDLLQRRKSPLASRICKGDFDEGFPQPISVDKRRFVFDRIDELTELIDHVEPPGDNRLPPIPEDRDGRILWSLSIDDEIIGFEVRHQKRKKRGSGFLKGRRLSLNQLLNNRNLPLSDADLRVIQHIENDDNGFGFYDYELQLGAFDVIEQLVGQDNAALNDHPVQIVRHSLIVTLVQMVDGQFCFRVVDEDAPSKLLPVFVDDERFVLVDRNKNRIAFSRCNASLVDALRGLFELPPIPEADISEVIRRIAPLRQRIAICLPRDIGGPQVSMHGQPAVLLRLRNDGQLDVAMRVRDCNGALYSPGDGPLVVASEKDGKPIQVVRSASAELQNALAIAESLNLTDCDQASVEPFQTTICDLSTAIQLLGRLQSGSLDVEVLWDPSSEKPPCVLGSLTSNNVRVEIESKRNWFGITGQCDFENGSMPLHELLSQLPTDAAQRVGDYVRIGEHNWVRIETKLRQRLKRLRDTIHVDRKSLKLDATAAPVVRDLVEANVDIKGTKAWNKCLQRLAEAEELEPVLPRNLSAELRDYQIDGFNWLSRLAAWGVGGILADDMGLGKTLQALAVLLDRAAEGPALVIAPTSVGYNWIREAERFAPDLDVHMYRETERSDFLPSVGPNSLVVCSYGLALRDAKALSAVNWNSLVLDEAQAIKNSRSKTSRAISTFEADWTVALTGTPVENHLGELWSLFHVVSPGVFGGWDSFRKRYAIPIEKYGDQEVREALAERLKPFMLRRTKDEVLTELPPRTEMNLYVELSREERSVYERVRREAIGEASQIKSLSDNQDQRFKILALMTRLRQISCHAGLVDSSWQGSSAKLEQLVATLESLREEQHRALVFSQFTSHLALIRNELDARGFTYEYLDGSIPPKERQNAVDRFQEGTADAFLISLKAGGTGLNLTAADYVIHMDPWWNPAVEDQATDRAHRFGQDRPVMVYRIVSRGTIEEEILSLHESKRDLVEGVMSGTGAAAKLTNDDLIKLLRG